MQAGKHAMESSQQIGKTPMEPAKEIIANITASAKSGMDKTISVIEEKISNLLLQKGALESSGPLESAKETIANIAASAKSGMEKTRALIEEKVEIYNTVDPNERNMATQRKDDKIRQAELQKQEAYSQNAAAASSGIQSNTTAGERVDNHTTTGTESSVSTSKGKETGKSRAGPKP